MLVLLVLRALLSVQLYKGDPDSPIFTHIHSDPPLLPLGLTLKVVGAEGLVAHKGKEVPILHTHGKSYWHTCKAPCKK